MAFLSWPQVVSQVNGHLGTDYQLLERLGGGRQGGAWTVIDGAAGSRPVVRVLTWTSHPGLVARRAQTARIVRDLRRRGYPTPCWHHWGTMASGVTFVIADLAPGHTGTWDTMPVEDLIAAVELQAGAAGRSDGSWSDYLSWALTAPDGPRADLAALGATADPLLRRIDDTARLLSRTTIPSGDAVHGDLTLDNILIDHTHTRTGQPPRIAIIDIGACGPGTRALDYAWLYRDATTRDARPAAARLQAAGRGVAGDHVWQLCLALACLEVAAFVARHGTGEDAAAELTTQEAVLSHATTHS